MRRTDERLDELARARLAFVVSGGQLVPAGPRRAADPADDAGPKGIGIEDLEDWAPYDFERSREQAQHPGDPASPAAADEAPGHGLEADPSPGHQPWTGNSALDRGRRFVEGHLSAVCLVLGLGLVVTAAVVMRARPTTVDLGQQPLTASSPSPLAAQPRTTSTGPGSPTPATPPTPGRIRVHVAGAVVRPGVVTLPVGARVADALGASGGLRQDSRLGQLNLAAPLGDGDQVWVGDTNQPGGEVRPAAQAVVTGPGGQGPSPGSDGDGRGGSPAGAAGTSGQVDLNQATLEQLDQLPGVGPVTAQRILAWRQEHQRFTRIEELQEVDGIGPKTYAQLSAHVRV